MTASISNSQDPSSFLYTSFFTIASVPTLYCIGKGFESATVKSSLQSFRAISLPLSMGFFDHLNKQGSKAIKPQAIKVKKETIQSSASKSGTRPITLQNDSKNRSHTKKIVDDRPSIEHKPTESDIAKVRKRAQPSQGPLLSSSEDSDSQQDADSARPRKRSRIESSRDQIDPKRQLRDTSASKGNVAASLVHGASIASASMEKKYRLYFDDVTAPAFLQYPGLDQQERSDRTI